MKNCTGLQNFMLYVISTKYKQIIYEACHLNVKNSKNIPFREWNVNIEKLLP